MCARVRKKESDANKQRGFSEVGQPCMTALLVTEECTEQLVTSPPSHIPCCSLPICLSFLKGVGEVWIVVL